MILILRLNGWDVMTAAWTASDAGAGDNRKTSICMVSTRSDPYVRLKIPLAAFEQRIRQQVGNVCDLREWCEEIS